MYGGLHVGQIGHAHHAYVHKVVVSAVRATWLMAVYARQTERKMRFRSAAMQSHELGEIWQI